MGQLAWQTPNMGIKTNNKNGDSGILNIKKGWLCKVLEVYMVFFGQFTKFASVGAFATFIQYFILIILVFFKNDVVLSSSIGFFVSSLFNFELNRKYTFNSKHSRKETLPLFYIVVSIGLLLNALMMHLFVNIMNFQYILGQIVSTGVVLSSNFLLNKRFVFK